MTRWALILGCACVLGVFGAGCSTDDSEDGGSSGAAGSSAGTGSGNAGTSSSGGSGAGGRAGSGGSVGTAGTGNGGTGVTAGTNGGAGSGVSGSAGSAGTAGTAGASGESGAGGGTACGSRGLPECPSGSFCRFSVEADCGRADAPGTCSVLTDVACGEIWSPVCGCDGATHSSSCHAQQAGTSIDHVGECGGAGPPPGYQCVADEGLACLIALPSCVEGEVSRSRRVLRRVRAYRCRAASPSMTNPPMSPPSPPALRSYTIRLLRGAANAVVSHAVGARPVHSVSPTPTSMRFESGKTIDELLRGAVSQATASVSSPPLVMRMSGVGGSPLPP